ncbi:tetratricopeptide repeat protein [Sinorhizobium chiapasense]|uniref:Tetratricopeptide repeat protein n=1 Tax=Sinorhizobium chiapasense TaxID=501572 RepID=A0ABZ2BMC8_9HYPH
MTEQDRARAALSAEINPGATDLCIHFTARNGAAGQFNRFPTPPGSSNIYVNSIKPNWYLDGLPGRDGIDGTVGELRERIDQSKAKRITTIGSSMGAWGASYYAPMIGANTAILFGPELSLNCFGGFSAADLTKRTPLPTIKAGGECRYVTVAGGLSPSDLACSINFFNDDHSNCFIIPRMAHGTSAELSNLGLLDRIIAELVEGRSAILDMLQHPQIDQLVPLFYGRDYDFTVLLEYVRFHVRKAGYGRMVLRIAEDLVARRLPKEAAFLLEDAHPSVSANIEARALLLKCAQATKQHDRAVSLADGLLPSREHRQMALWAKGLALESLGRNDEARQAFQLICDEHRENDLFVKAVAKLDPPQPQPEEVGAAPKTGNWVQRLLKLVRNHQDRADATA